jgi:hypothetical protein
MCETPAKGLTVRQSVARLKRLHWALNRIHGSSSQDSQPVPSMSSRWLSVCADFTVRNTLESLQIGARDAPAALTWFRILIWGDEVLHAGFGRDWIVLELGFQVEAQTYGE